MTPLIVPLVLLMQAQICFAQIQLVGATNSLLLDSPPAAQQMFFGNRGVRVHDPSTIIKCGDEFLIFYTGCGVPSYHSKDLVKRETGPPVFNNAPTWTEPAVPAHRGNYFWAPEHHPSR